jgi:hypothetical protein
MRDAKREEFGWDMDGVASSRVAANVDEQLGTIFRSHGRPKAASSLSLNDVEATARAEVNRKRSHSTDASKGKGKQVKRPRLVSLHLECVFFFHAQILFVV